MRDVITIKNISESGVQNINFIINILSVDDILSCMQEENVRDACRTGCVNYGKKWSCPPYSKKFSDIVKVQKYNTAIIIVGYINLSDMYYISNPYQQVKAANMMLKSKCERIARYIEKEMDSYSLLSGSCNLCKPCQKKKDLPCKKPEMMRYSLESTGINVEALLDKYCEHKLLWYKKGEKMSYTSVAVANLIDCSVMSYNNIELLIKKYIKKLSNN